MAKPRVNRYSGPSGFVDDVADGTDIRGAQGPPGAAGAGGNALQFATVAETEAGTVTDKVISPHTDKAALDDRIPTKAEATAGTATDKFMTPLSTEEVFGDKKAGAADITAGTSGKWVDAAQLKTAVPENVPAKATEADVQADSNTGYVPPNLLKAERDARQAVDQDLERAARKSLSLSTTQAQAFRRKIGAEASGQRDYDDTTIGTWNYNASPRSSAAEDTGLSIPEGAVTLRVQARAGDLYQDISVAQLLSRPDVVPRNLAGRHQLHRLRGRAGRRAGRRGTDARCPQGPRHLLPSDQCWGRADGDLRVPRRRCRIHCGLTGRSWTESRPGRKSTRPL